MSKKIDTLPLGCMGNKRNELKLLLPIIEPHLDEDSIFVEPFCGSSIVSFNIFMKHNIKCHINDIDELRIKFYNNMNKEKERQKLYKLEQEILNKGEKFYYSIVREGDDEYLKYVISRRIHAIRYGLFPTTKKLILHEISPNWKSFFKDSIITNKDYKVIFEKYKDNEKAFLYLDPPYMDSYNAGYNSFQGANHDKEFNIIDNTKMYIDFINILKDCKCKVLFSINDCALTRYLYKDYIKDTYNHIYQSTYKNIKELNEGKNKKNTNVLIISNF